MRIAIIGQKQSGKSLLAYKLSRYLATKGVEAKLANFDLLSKRLAYKPDFDLRKYYRCTPDEAYPKAFRDQLVREDTSEGVWVLDFSSGLDWLLFSELPEFCDVFLFVVDSVEEKYAEMAKMLSSVYGIPFVLVVNLGEAVALSQQTLSAFSLPKTPSFKNAVLVNAEERDGFKELWETVLALVEGRGRGK